MRRLMYGLAFSFPSVHKDARLSIDFQRTLRIPDDGSDYSLPQGLGRFPLRHIDDHAENVPAQWIRQGGVMLPMYQSEAMWLYFSANYVPGHGVPYPFAIKIAAGKIEAVTGKEWTNSLHRRPQDYMVAPQQPWRDGFCVEKGVIRQFVAMPLGSGYSAEEQITGKGEYGGLQIIVYPMKREVFERRFPKYDESRFVNEERVRAMHVDACASGADMGLAPGGRMKQEIYADPFDLDDWDIEHLSRCFVHITNSLVWRAITGEQPPTVPPTSKEYTQAGLPWFAYYDDSATALDGADILKHLKSVMEMGWEKRDVPLPENETVPAENVIQLRRKLMKDQVREGEWV
jgi:hypothetical protein